MSKHLLKSQLHAQSGAPAQRKFPELMRITEGVFITRYELLTKSRRGNSKKVSAETMFVEE